MTIKYETIDVLEMTPKCGGFVEGVDLSQDISNQQFKEIYDAVVDRVVVIFRGQKLTPKQHVSFSKKFGKTQASAVSGFEKNTDYPEIDNLAYDADNPPHVTRDLWHTDFAGREKPTWGTLLYAREIPPEGGDTIWVNNVAAYEALSDRMKQHIDGLTAYHDSYRPYGETIRPEMWEDGGESLGRLKTERSTYQPALHPVVRTHPDSGKKGLFVNESMTTKIRELDFRESDYLLRFLFDHLRTPEFQYRHKWEADDLAIWDNRTSLHYALFDYDQYRLMHRIVIEGDAPYQ